MTRTYTRHDGRKTQELRDISISFDGLDGVDGSARFGFGETKALCSVSGPMEVRLAAEQASKATFEVIVRPLVGFPGTESKALGSALRNALLPSMVLNANPRTLVQLVAQALATPSVPSWQLAAAAAGPKPNSVARSDPALVAATINAASLALLNASSIPLRGVVCAIAIGRVHDTHELLADPSDSERGALDGGGIFAFLISGARVGSDAGDIENTSGSGAQAELVWTSWGAGGGLPFDEDELRRATVLAKAGALCVWGHIKEAVARLVLGPEKVEMPKLKREVKETVLDDAKMEIS